MSLNKSFVQIKTNFKIIPSEALERNGNILQNANVFTENEPLADWWTPSELSAAFYSNARQSIT